MTPHQARKARNVQPATVAALLQPDRGRRQVQAPIVLYLRRGHDLPHLDLNAWLAPTGQRSSAGLSPAQALRLGMLLRRELPSPVGVLPSLLSQRPTLISEVLMHSRDVLLDLGDRLSHPGDPRPERLALRPCVLGSLERSRAAGVRIGHDGDRVPLRPAALPVTGQPDARRTWHGRDDRPCYIGRPIRSLVAKTRARTGVRVRAGTGTDLGRAGAAHHRKTTDKSG